MNQFGKISFKRGGRCGDTPSSLEVVMTEKEKLVSEIIRKITLDYDGQEVEPSPNEAGQIADFILARDKKKRGEEITLDSLKSNPMYDHINIDQEFQKARQWILLKGSGRKLTPRFFVAWLNRIEKPLQETKKCNQIQMEAF
jgi:hypothetical protein